MKSVTEILLESIEDTKEKFLTEHGAKPEQEKAQFVKWYFRECDAPYEVIISDLSDYLLHISENRILRLLNAPE